MKRLLALLLVLAAVFCAGCSEEPAPTTEPTTEAPTEAPTTEPTESPTTEPTEPPTMANDYFDPVAAADLIKTWTVDVVLDGSLMNFTDMESSTTMKLQYQLNADGTYVRGVEQKEYDSAIAAYESYIRSYMLGQRYAKFTAEQKLLGKKEAKIKEEWEQSGWPVAQAEVSEFVENLHLGYRFSTLNRSGDYYIAGGILYLSRDNGTYEECGYELTEEGLSILSSTDPTTYSQLKLDFPLLLIDPTAVEAEPTEVTEATEATE